MKITLFFLLLSIGFLSACAPESADPLLKSSTSDPFRDALPESQFFALSSENDTVIEGIEGTTVVLPKGCFLDAKGNTYTGSFDLELAEANQLEDQLLTNLTSENEGQPQFSKNSLFWNATTPSGDPLQINPEIPIYIEMPTNGKALGMEARHGVRGENGEMNWKAPRPQVKFLTPMDLDQMDLYPEGFEAAAERGMPFRGHLVADHQLKDSLFYSLSITNPGHLSEGFALTDAYEQGLSWRRDAQNPNIIRAEKVSREEYNLAEEHGEYHHAQDSVLPIAEKNCGIDPASIKVLRSGKFANSLIATKEFQERVKYIFKTCSQEILEVYVNGLDKELWEVDQEATNLLVGGVLRDRFQEFADEKMGHLEESNPYAKQLSKLYARKLKKTRKQLQKVLDKAKKELAIKNKIAQATAEEYAKVLDERQAYRMERFGFTATKTGWYDVSNPQSPHLKDWTYSSNGESPVQITVVDGNEFERTMVYLLTITKNSIHRMSSEDGTLFQTGSGEYDDIPIPREDDMEVFVISWKGEESYFAKATIGPGRYQKSLTPKLADMTLIKQQIQKVDLAMNKANQISHDLDYQKAFFAEEKRQNTLRDEADFLRGLYLTLHACCSDASSGEMLFNANCRLCHNANLTSASTGPPLFEVTKRHNRSWFYPWIRNSAAVIASGDQEAVEVWEKNNKAAMSPMPHLSDKDIDDILLWIDQESEKIKMNP